VQGFDAEFADLPDYIVKITERIWEGRGIGLIRRWYAPDVLMHTSMGPARGVEAVVGGTLDTLCAFPDRRLLPEDIIWSGDDRAGYLSSHRIMAPATHLGASGFGPPTGRAVAFRAIADCFARDNVISEEWLVRDQAGIAAQIGMDPAELGRAMAQRDAAAGREPWHAEPARQLRAQGGFRPAELSDHRAAALVRDTLAGVWGAAELDRIAQAYHPACEIHAPGALTLNGHERLWRWLFGLLAAFPDLGLAIEHSIAMGDAARARVSTRWWMTATHSGHGRFGPPSGATVLLLGITHSDVEDGRIRREWIVADEVALHKQIAQARG
jgi:predicted ester cyclase